MRARIAVIPLIGIIALIMLAGGVPPARAATVTSLPRPHRFGLQTAGETTQFIQVAAANTAGRSDGAIINGVDMKLAHVLNNDAANIIAPGRAASYSFSIGAYTTTGYWLEMGYIVLGDDGNGLARWFTRVLDKNGNEIFWKLSRAGAADPPPACSACSGGSTDGYPFAFTSDTSGTWTFWFDGLNRGHVALPDSKLDAAKGVYFIGEVTAANSVGANIMGPRTALRTLSLWSNQLGNWREAASASSSYFDSTGASVCPPFGIAPAGVYSVAGNYPGVAHETAAGSSVTCSSAWLWTNL
jgi:hypothetical protein